MSPVRGSLVAGGGQTIHLLGHLPVIIEDVLILSSLPEVAFSLKEPYLASGNALCS